jgi:hypothetical protein
MNGVSAWTASKEEGEAFLQEYDMGHSWWHQVLVEKVGADSS